MATEVENYRNFIRNSPEAIWCFTLPTPLDPRLPTAEQINIIYRDAYLSECNDATARMYGFSKAEEMIGQKLSQFLIDDESNRAYLTAFIEAGYRLVDAESSEIDREGQPKRFLNSLVGTLENQKLVNAWGSQRDITDQKRREERLITQNAVSKILTETESVSIALQLVLQTVCLNLNWDFGALWRTEPGGQALKNVVLWHRAGFKASQFKKLTQTLEYPIGVGMPGGVLKKREALWTENVLDDPNFPRRNAAKEGDLRCGFGFPVRIGEKILGIIEFYSVEIRPPDEDLLKMFSAIGSQLGLFMARAAAEEALRESESRKLAVLENANQQLQQTSRLKSEFTSIVSHELRTPLAIIKEGVELVLDEAEGEIGSPNKETLRVAKNNIERLSRLVNNVLDFSRLESGKIRTNFENTDLDDLILGIGDLMKTVIQRKAIRFKVNLPDESLSAEIDADKMSQILINLIENAVKYTEMGGEVSVTARQQGDAIEIRVQDSGIGIEPEDQKNIFEMYGQSLYYKHLKTGGVGVGLAVCKRLIEIHNGTISVESVLGKGTAFIVRFPVRHSSLSAPA